MHAYIAGEHGDSEIPLWFSASIGNVPVQGWRMPGRPALSVQEEKEIFESVRTSAEKIIQGKGATNYAIGLAVTAILEAILWNEGRVLPGQFAADGLSRHQRRLPLYPVRCEPQRSGRITASVDESGGGGRSALQRRDYSAGGARAGLLTRFHDGYTGSGIAIAQHCLSSHGRNRLFQILVLT